MLLYTIILIAAVLFFAGLIAGSFDSIFYDEDDYKDDKDES
jgi:hypothetical protein